MTNDLSAVRTQLAEASAAVKLLQQRRLDLQAQLAETEVQERAAQAQAATLAAEVQRLEVEPVARERLERLLPTLHARLAKAPHRSPTAQRIRSSLPRLADENTPAADRLSLCRSLLDDLVWRVELDFEFWAAATPRVSGRE